MNTKNQGLGIARAAILSIALFFAGELVNAQTAAGAGITAKDKAAIETDVGTLNSQQAKVSDLEKKYKDDRRTGNKEMEVIDKKELSKARAELKKDRSFFAADVRDVQSDDRMVIRNGEKAVRQDKADLRKARKDLKAAKKRSDEVAIRSEEARVSACEKILENDKAKLDREKEKRSNDRAFLKKEVKNLEGNHAWVYIEGL